MNKILSQVKKFQLINRILRSTLTDTVKLRWIDRANNAISDIELDSIEETRLSFEQAALGRAVWDKTSSGK